MSETRDPGPGWVPWRGGQVAIGLLLVALSVLLVSAIAFPLGDLVGRYKVAVVAWATSQLLGVILLAVVWYLGPRRYRVPVSSLGLTPPHPPQTKAVLMTIGALGASLGATALYGWLVGLTNSNTLSPPDIPRDIVFPGLAAVFSFQALAIWTPVAEEVFFRGFVFAGLVPRLGLTRAMVASALIFSIFHLTPGLLVPVFTTGILLAWLYYRTGSLWATILAHAGQNLVALLVTIYGG